MNLTHSIPANEDWYPTTEMDHTYCETVDLIEEARERIHSDEGLEWFFLTAEKLGREYKRARAKGSRSTP